MKREAKLKALIVDSLRKHFNVKVACTAAGIGRATFYRWMAGDERFAADCREAEVEGRDDYRDLLMVKHQQLVRDGNPQAILFGLRHMHPYFSERPSFVLPGNDDQLLADLRDTFKRIAVAMLRRGLLDDKGDVDADAFREEAFRAVSLLGENPPPTLNQTADEDSTRGVPGSIVVPDDEGGGNPPPRPRPNLNTWNTGAPKGVRLTDPDVLPPGHPAVHAPEN